MLVPMMDVGKMGMPVLDRHMLMPVGMPSVTWLQVIVAVLVVLVVHVLVFVCQRLVEMDMGMMLGKVEPYANGHQASCQQ